MHHSTLVTKSKYSDWSNHISSFLPKTSVSIDNAQLFSNFMVLIAVAGVFPLAFQAYTIYKTKKTEGISLTAFAFQVFISFMWTFYGFITRNGIILISSVLKIIASILLVYFGYKYSDKEDILSN